MSFPPMPPSSVPPMPPAALSLPVGAATAQSAARIEQAVRLRGETDTRFLNWWLFVFLVNWITLGIGAIYFFYRRMSRIDAFSRRKLAYYQGLVEYTEQRAAAAGLVVVRPITDQLRADVGAASASALKPIGAGLNFLLVIITFGLWGIVVYYKVNRAWDDRQRFEAHFDEGLSLAWLQMGMLRSPITFRVDEGKRRNFLVWLLASFVTFGLWAIVWDYRVWTDPDRLYPEFHVVEDAVLQIIRTA